MLNRVWVTMKYYNAKILCGLLSGLLLSACNSSNEQGAFPYNLPPEKPNRNLSAAVERVYDNYRTPLQDDNELYSQFKYTELKGFDYNDCDGTITRRDPSKVIRYNGKYYVWYTHRDTETAPIRTEKTQPNIPSRDWDLAEIWYATSNDGFTWEEQGVAVPIPNGIRAVSTTDILIWKGKYYLYYQAFPDNGDGLVNDCYVTVSYADSPDGPWMPAGGVVVQNGAEGEWDSKTLHDPNPLVHNGKIYLYYKSDFDDTIEHFIKMAGLAIANDPLGPFEKHPLNPVLNSGHEVSLFPYEEGIAALVIRDGHEHFTVQYAPDGVNFEIETITELMPISAGSYIPDAFTDTKDGRGITWGICHVNHASKVKGAQNSILMRFDCDLSRDLHDPQMKISRYLYKPEFYYQHGLTPRQRERIQQNN
jgi:hypothetical protein